LTKRGNGEGSIYYQKSRDRYVAASIDVSGQRKYVYGKTREDVAGKLVTALDARQKGLTVPSQKQTLAQYLDEWLENTVQPARRPGTYLRYQTAVRLHIAPAIGKVKLAQVGPQHVQLLQKRLLDKGLGRKSIDLVRATLSGALTQAMRWGLILRNPVSLVQPPYSEDEEPRALTPEQATALLNAVAGHEYEQLYTVMLATGLRIGEALALRWQDVELERNRLHVRQQLTVLPGQPVQFTPPKSRSGRRTIPLIPAAVTALRAQRAIDDAHLVGSLLVFSNELGQPLVGRRVERLFKECLRKAHMPTTFTPHSLRHSTATYLMARGVPARVIMEIMGHSSITMTARYQHIIESVLDDAAERLAQIFPSASR